MYSHARSNISAGACIIDDIGMRCIYRSDGGSSLDGGVVAPSQGLTERK